MALHLEDGGWERGGGKAERVQAFGEEIEAEKVDEEGRCRSG